MPTILVVIILLAGAASAQEARAAESKIMSLYGGFEQGRLDGWEKTDPNPCVEYRIVNTGAREGTNCLEVIHPKGTEKYLNPGVKIIPYTTWNTRTPCRLKFSVRNADPQIGGGYYLAMRVKGRDEEKKDYEWRYYVFSGSDNSAERMKQRFKAWGDKEDPLAKQMHAKSTGFLFIEYLPGLQTGPWTIKSDTWVDFTANIAESFNAVQAPVKPATIEFTEISFGGTDAYCSGWRLDAIGMEFE